MENDEELEEQKRKNQTLKLSNQRNISQHRMKILKQNRTYAKFRKEERKFHLDAKNQYIEDVKDENRQKMLEVKMMHHNQARKQSLLRKRRLNQNHKFYSN